MPLDPNNNATPETTHQKVNVAFFDISGVLDGETCIATPAELENGCVMSELGEGYYLLLKNAAQVVRNINKLQEHGYLLILTSSNPVDAQKDFLAKLKNFCDNPNRKEKIKFPTFTAMVIVNKESPYTNCYSTNPHVKEEPITENHDISIITFNEKHSENKVSSGKSGLRESAETWLKSQGMEIEKEKSLAFDDGYTNCLAAGQEGYHAIMVGEKTFAAGKEKEKENFEKYVKATLHLLPALEYAVAFARQVPVIFLSLGGVLDLSYLKKSDTAEKVIQCLNTLTTVHGYRLILNSHFPLADQLRDLLKLEKFCTKKELPFPTFKAIVAPTHPGIPQHEEMVAIHKQWSKINIAIDENKRSPSKATLRQTAEEILDLYDDNSIDKTKSFVLDNSRPICESASTEGYHAFMIGELKLLDALNRIIALSNGDQMEVEKPHNSNNNDIAMSSFFSPRQSSEVKSDKKQESMEVEEPHNDNNNNVAMPSFFSPAPSYPVAEKNKNEYIIAFDMPYCVKVHPHVSHRPDSKLQNCINFINHFMKGKDFVVHFVIAAHDANSSTTREYLENIESSCKSISSSNPVNFVVPFTIGAKESDPYKQLDAYKEKYKVPNENIFFFTADEDLSNRVKKEKSFEASVIPASNVILVPKDNGKNELPDCLNDWLENHFPLRNGKEEKIDITGFPTFIELCENKLVAVEKQTESASSTPAMKL